MGRTKVEVKTEGGLRIGGGQRGQNGLAKGKVQNNWGWNGGIGIIRTMFWVVELGGVKNGGRLKDCI